MSYHIPVLLKQSVELLDIKPDGLYVDVTYGGGGHSKAILQQLTTGKLFAFDRDQDASGNVVQHPNLHFIPKDFQFIEEALQEVGVEQLDGILADLGVSSHQLDTANRGFSFRFDAPLDMRMNQSRGKTASDLLNQLDESDLVHIFSMYGEVKNSKKLARTICSSRKAAPIQNSSQLETVIQSCIPPKRRNKYLAQVYQALRIQVNGEMDSLESLLIASLKLLKIGGRMVVISYHSLEDRMVKRFFRSGNIAGKLHKDFYGNPLTPWKIVNRKLIIPDEAELDKNPRSRSAKLRAAERC